VVVILLKEEDKKGLIKAAGGQKMKSICLFWQVTEIQTFADTI